MRVQSRERRRAAWAGIIGAIGAGIGRRLSPHKDAAMTISPLLDTAISAARAAEAIIRRYYAGEVTVRLKADQTPVTAADVIFPGGLNARLEELVMAVNPSWEIIEMRTFFKFKSIVITSSETPSMVENSWLTPLIFTSVIAAPGSDESMIRRSEFPRV